MYTERRTNTPSPFLRDMLDNHRIHLRDDKNFLVAYLHTMDSVDCSRQILSATMSLCCYIGVCSDLLCGICCTCIVKPSRPSWNPKFSTIVNITRRISHFTFQNVKASDFPKLRTQMERKPPESELPKGVKVVPYEHLDNNSALPRCHWIYPESYTAPSLQTTAGAVILFFHGGGFCMGSVDSYQGLTMKICKETNTTILAINYRLAPEHPYPAGENDCLDSYKWLVTNVSPNQVFLMGDSAGGALVVRTLVRAKDEGLALPKASILISPWVDMFNSLDDSFTKYYDIDYVGPSIVALAAMYVSPPSDSHSSIYQQLEGLPPMLIEYGEVETFSGQIRRFIDRAKSCGVSVDFNEYPDMVHVFQMFYNTDQRQCIESFLNMKKFIDKLMLSSKN